MDIEHITYLGDILLAMIVVYSQVKVSKNSFHPLFCTILMVKFESRPQSLTKHAASSF